MPGNYRISNTSSSTYDTFTIESVSPASLVVPANCKLNIKVNVSLLGYKLQVNQNAELRIDTGSDITFSDFFYFYNYGTISIGEGANITLKNMNNYAGSQLIVNGTSANPVNFKMWPSGTLTLRGGATVNHAIFIKESTSNFRYINIIGNAARTSNHVVIQGSDYGFHLSNSASSTHFNNVNGVGRIVKCINSVVYINGLSGTTAAKSDGISAYTNSYVYLNGDISIRNYLVGMRSAYNSMIDFYDEHGFADIKFNTRGIWAYYDARVDMNIGSLFINKNIRPDPIFNLSSYDLTALTNAQISLVGELDPLHYPTKLEESGGNIVIINTFSGGGLGELKLMSSNKINSMNADSVF